MTILDNKPNLRLTDNAPNGTFYIGTRPGMNIRGSDLYVWKNGGTAEFVGVHMPNYNAARMPGVTDGMSKLAMKIREAHEDGFIVSYDLPSHAKKGDYRALDDEERLKLRVAQGLPDLKLAA